MLGLQRGTVVLVPHQSEWESAAAETIAQLRAVLGDTAVDIQYVGRSRICRPSSAISPRWNLAGADRLWCAAFVYYCCVEAGFSIPARPRECVSGNLAGCLCWEEFALGDPRIEYHPRGYRAFSPACGDIVLYDRVFIDCEHDPIGIVLEVQEDSLTAAEGNTFHDNISRLVERKRDDHIRAYIRLPDHYRYEE